VAPCEKHMPWAEGSPDMKSIALVSMGQAHAMGGRLTWHEVHDPSLNAQLSPARTVSVACAGVLPPVMCVWKGEGTMGGRGGRG